MTARTIQHGGGTAVGAGPGWLRGLVLAAMFALAVRAPQGQGAGAVPNTTAAPPLPVPPASSASVAESDAPPTEIVPPKLPGMPQVRGEIIDRPVAIVNGELVLDSDVDQEIRFTALLPNRLVNAPDSRAGAVERLINRDLILQQAQLEPGAEVSPQAAQKDLDTVRRSIPQCKAYHCETRDGWERFLATKGFTEASLTTLWRQRMEVMAFIEARFRMGIEVSPEDIRSYYEKTMLPQYAALHQPAPPVRSITRGIREVLLQQKVAKLLDDWLQSLRAQGSVVVLHPGTETP